MAFQFAQDEDRSVGDFAVIEYETAEQAEEVQQDTDGLLVKGKTVDVYFCAPGVPGRGTLATLLAAQRMVMWVGHGCLVYSTGRVKLSNRICI